ncbi:MAG: FAD-binding protein [Longimicrobiales bacterium]
MTTLTPVHPDDIVQAMREYDRLVAHGACTKRPLIGGVRATERGSPGSGTARLDMTRLTGVTEYEPAEFTFTARAGTRLRDIEALLAANGQYMPFDPPLADDGATIGGTLAAGVNGPCRLRYGGLRDFVIGVHFVDGTATLVHGGGKVVKNAAGFDLPRLLVGSMGRLGVLVDLTFKVFPSPQARCTLRIACNDLPDAVARLADLGRHPLELDALDLEPPATLCLRLAGDAASLPHHAQRVGLAAARRFDILDGDDDARYWLAQSAFAWVIPEHWLIKVPLALNQIVPLDSCLDRHDVPRRYSVAGNVCWLAWPVDEPLTQLDLQGRTGLVVRDTRLDNAAVLDGAFPYLGVRHGRDEPFARRVKAALDPHQRLPALV